MVVHQFATHVASHRLNDQKQEAVERGTSLPHPPLHQERQKRHPQPVACRLIPICSILLSPIKKIRLFFNTKSRYYKNLNKRMAIHRKTGEYQLSTNTGEAVRAYVPTPLPPQPPVELAARIPVFVRIAQKTQPLRLGMQSALAIPARRMRAVPVRTARKSSGQLTGRSLADEKENFVDR